jgi:hypothetical protein
MNNLLDVLLDPGDGILISAPYYLGFDAMCMFRLAPASAKTDVRWIGTKRNGGVLVGVPMDIGEDGWEAEGDVEGRMERAWEECRAKGIPVRFFSCSCG